MEEKYKTMTAITVSFLSENTWTVKCQAILARRMQALLKSFIFSHTGVMPSIETQAIDIPTILPVSKTLMNNIHKFYDSNFSGININKTIEMFQNLESQGYAIKNHKSIQ
jgi:hypothetical protein